MRDFKSMAKYVTVQRRMDLVQAVTIFMFMACSASLVMAQQQAPVPKVQVSAAFIRDIAEEDILIGHVEAIDTVNIVARVSGFLDEVTQSDGATVKEGDVLYRIEPFTYEATLEARRAELARAEANLKLAELDLARKQTLFERKTVSEAERDVAQAEKSGAEAEVRAAHAAIKQAELDLSYTVVHAPFGGRIGRNEISLGDLVGPGTSSLTTLIRQAPIFVTFSVTEKQLVQLLEVLEEREDAGGPPPEVYAILPTGNELDEAGKLTFIDNRVNPATGSITVRATFQNDRGLLVDGSFVNVRILQRNAIPRVLIPRAAIQRDQRGDFVLVVSQTGNVEQRYVQTGLAQGSEIVIEDGVREGETVITEGLQRVRPGVQVEAVLAGTGD